MAVDGPLGDARARGDRRGRGAPEPDGRVEVEGGTEELLPGRLAVAFAGWCAWNGHPTNVMPSEAEPSLTGTGGVEANGPPGYLLGLS